MKTLVLNASHQFLSVKSWQEVIVDVWLGEVEVLENYDKVVRSPSIELPVPAVVMHKRYIPVNFKRLLSVGYSHYNVFARDRYICQYCGITTAKKLGKKSTELEHIIPKHQGGGSTWLNTVTSCRSCNNYKGGRTPEQAGMKLIRKPYIPHKTNEVLRIKIGEIHPLWEKHLFGGNF